MMLMRERHCAWICAQSLVLPCQSFVFTRERVLERQCLVPKVDLVPVVRPGAIHRIPQDRALADIREGGCPAGTAGWNR
jgi:hypothetical protein